MDINRLCEEERQRGWDCGCRTEYEVQEHSAFGNNVWLPVQTFETLDEAVQYKCEAINLWCGNMDPDELGEYLPVRIVMRHVVEVVL